MLRHEGGLVDDPDDRGGRTAYGITQKTYDAYRTDAGLAERDVFEMTEDERAAIYRGIWTSAGCEGLFWPLSLIHFDSTVNSGPRRAEVWRSSATWLKVDPSTIAYAYLTLRRTFLRGLAGSAGQDKFLKGWMNRIDSLAKESGL